MGSFAMLVQRRAHDVAAEIFLRTVDPDSRTAAAWRAFAAKRALARTRPSKTDAPVVLLAVYRAKYAELLDLLLCQCPAQTDVRLWALDEIPEHLAPSTVGSGRGSKFELIRRLASGREIPKDSWVVVADDDVFLSRGSVTKLLERCKAGGIDIGQPAHSLASFRNHLITVMRPWSAWRRTGFVEIGPLFVVAPGRFETVIPPDTDGMGWGLEFYWHSLIRDGVRLGIVDTCHIMHCGPTGADYSMEAALSELMRRYPGRGLEDLSEVKQCYETVPRWRLLARHGGA